MKAIVSIYLHLLVGFLVVGQTVTFSNKIRGQDGVDTPIFDDRDRKSVV